MGLGVLTELVEVKACAKLQRAVPAAAAGVPAHVPSPQSPLNAPLQPLAAASTSFLSLSSRGPLTW